jgi:hypothetical protein
MEIVIFVTNKNLFCNENTPLYNLFAAMALYRYIAGTATGG